MAAVEHDAEKPLAAMKAEKKEIGGVAMRDGASLAAGIAARRVKWREYAGERR